KDYNFINLNSDFAVNFVMEYEKVDLIIISRGIGDIDNICRKAQKKKIKVYKIGKDLKEPVNRAEIERVLDREYKNKVEHPGERKIKISDLLFRFGRARTEAGVPEEMVAKKEKDEQKPAKVNRERLNPKTDSFTNLPVRAIKQKIIVFAKAKGGVGSTILSIYLGFCFRNLKTLLIDLNFSQGGGDTSYYLNIPKFPNIVNFTSGYNGKSIKESIINYKDGFDILQAPPTVDLSKMIELQDIYSMVDIVKKKYDIIIFDLPNILNDLNMGVIDLADILVMVSDSSVGSIGRLSELNKQFEYNDLHKILVLNKQNPERKAEIREYYKVFSIQDILTIDNIGLLADKSDFSNFDFSSVGKLENFSSKILNLLTTIQVINK
ncbi:MAG: AAA family ATPase, partial [Actinomycetota bacterium]